MATKLPTKVLIINYHMEVPGFSAGKLNNSMCELAEKFFTERNAEVRRVNITEEFKKNGKWDVEAHFKNYNWCDHIFHQTPTFWMGLPWIGKRYVDEVFSAGMGGQLATGDGRHSAAPEDGYGTGFAAGIGADGASKTFQMSLTYNAPAGAFNRPDQYLMEGKSVDDMHLPTILNYKWMGYRQAKFADGTTSTFSCHDVIKNPKIEQDFARFQEHMNKLFSA